MGEVCDLLPESYKEQCDDFIAKYGTEIVEFLLSSAAPHTICTLLHLCLFEEQMLPGQSHWAVSSCYWLHLNLMLQTLCWRQSRLFPRTASPAARWPLWADSTTAPTPPNPRPPLSSSLCVWFTPRPSPRSDPHQPLNSPQRNMVLKNKMCNPAFFQCEAFTKIYGPQLEKVLGNQLGSKHVCEVSTKL